MGVEFDRFVEPTRFLRFPNRVSEEGSRVFFAAGVEEVLAIIPEEPSMAAILDLAGDDQPTLWIQQVAQWLADFPGDSVSILELRDGVELSLCEVWMALLLRDVGWSIVQTGDFYYASALLVSRHQSLVKSKRLVKGD
jgi:hypothetical protein